MTLRKRRFLRYLEKAGRIVAALSGIYIVSAIDTALIYSEPIWDKLPGLVIYIVIMLAAGISVKFAEHIEKR